MKSPALRAATMLWAIAHAAISVTPAVAQVPGQQSPRESTAEPIADPLGRETPRGTIAGFIAAVDREDFESAARYMQLTGSQRPNREALGRDLNALMDRYFTGAVLALSDAPGGIAQDGLPLDRERISLTIAGKEVDLQLVRVSEGQSGQIWLISSDSLAQVPSLRRSLENTWIDRVMPAALLECSIFGNSLAHWIVWATSIGFPLVLLSLASRLVVRVARAGIGDPVRRSLLESWSGGLRLPIIVALALIIHAALRPFLGLSLGFRVRYERFLLVGLVLTFAWLLWQLLTLSFVHARIRALRKGQAGTRSLMLLGERVVKVVIVLVALFALLRIAGVETTTALAGVGIGGVAVALGAQKSVENLLGGVFLLTDKALAVGDFCCISNRVGWIEDITLRSVRLRTLEQTLLSIPAGSLSQASVENFVTRDKILIQSILRLRYGTTVEQLQSILDKIRALLAAHPQIERETSRVRLVDCGRTAFEIEVFAYARTQDVPTFMEIREGVLLDAAAIVEASGSAFARPADFQFVPDRVGAVDAHQDRTLAL